MKNLQNVLTVPVVNASNTIEINKGFNECTETWQAKNVIANTLFLLVLFMLLGVGMVMAQQGAIIGGKQKFYPANDQSDVSNNRDSITLVNKTGYDMYDLRIESTKKITGYDVNGSGGVDTSGKVTPWSTTVHIIFNKPVKKDSAFVLELTYSSPSDSIWVVPTDSIHADLMVERTINPLPTNVPGPGVPHKFTNAPAPISGGQQTIKFDGSNFPAITFVNNTGQEVCDMRIINIKPSSAKIDKVYVNKVKVYQCPNGSPGVASVHVFFPCIAKGGTAQIAVDFVDGVNVTSYDIVPTNKDSVNIGAAPVNFEPVKKLGSANGGSSSIPTGKGVKITGGSPGGKISVTGQNNSNQKVHDLIVQAFDKNKKPIPIKKVKVNGKEWPLTGMSSADSTTVHADKGTNPPVDKGSDFPIEVDAKSPGAQIDSLYISLTDTLHNIILVTNFDGNMKSFMIPNSYAPLGLSGRSGSLVAINESCSPISQLVFTSPDPGIKVESVVTPYPSIFDSILQVIIFTPALLPGVDIDLWFTLNTLCPIDSTDTTPFTTIQFFAPGSLPFDGYGTVTKPSCATAANGAIDFTITEGNAPIAFLWSNGSTSEDLENIPSGNYTVTVSSGLGCMMKSFEVTPSNTIPVVAKSNPTCPGMANGTIEILLRPAQADEAVVEHQIWISGIQTDYLTGLLAGNYPVMVTDNYGCISASTVSIADPLPVMVLGSVTNASCYGSFTGAIDITATGGSESYTYLWNNGSKVEDKINQKAGLYNVIVTDGLGCMGGGAFTIGQPTALSIAMPKVNINCGGAATGKLTANPAGGTAPYTYQWSNGATTKAAKNLMAGLYTVTVTDANGCTKTKSAVLTENPPLFVMVQQVGPNMAFANVAGGVPPYTFFWNTMPPQNTPQAINLMPGIPYTVTVTDSKGCSHVTTFMLGTMKTENDGEQLSISAFPNPASNVLNVQLYNSDATFVAEMYDAQGRLIYASANATDAYQILQIDLTSYASGLYTLRVISGNAISVSKISVKKD